MRKLKILLLFIPFILIACSTDYAKPIEKKPNKGEITSSPLSQPAHSSQPEPIVHRVKMTVVGDLMVHDWQLADALNQSNGTYHFDYSFDQVKDLLSNADLTVGNLETVLAGKDADFTGYPMFNTPEAFAESLRNAGFDLLTTANNHSNDRKEAGVLRTLEVLDRIGLDHVGTYPSKVVQNKIFIKEINNITFAFVSFTYGTNGIPLPKGKEYLINIMTKNFVINEIKKAKALNPDFVIVLPHMGNEYELMPSQAYIDWVNVMFNSGADLILASHPHVVQPVAYKPTMDENGVTRNKFVAYSLGNFISSQRTQPRDAGIMLHLYFIKTEGRKAELEHASYTPTWVQFKDSSNQYLIRTLSVPDVLKDQLSGGNSFHLRKQDFDRVKEVHNHLANILLQKGVPLENIQDEYMIPFERNGAIQ